MHSDNLVLEIIIAVAAVASCVVAIIVAIKNNKKALQDMQQANAKAIKDGFKEELEKYKELSSVRNTTYKNSEEILEHESRIEQLEKEQNQQSKKLDRIDNDVKHIQDDSNRDSRDIKGNIEKIYQELAKIHDRITEHNENYHSNKRD